jgi:Tol biopolymer transport system component
MQLTPGTKLGPYEITAPLGAGGMGEVYRARDSRLGRDVAIKVLPQHLSSNPEVRARFEREARTVSSLNHPSICVLFDVGREGDTDYLVMELIEGETLARRLEKGPVPLAELNRIGVQIADALDRAHRAGIVHRDLKPGNIMLTKSGAKLMDFGLARATGLAGPGSGSGVTIDGLTQSPTVGQPLTAEGTIVGTFQYMSPEQLEGKEADTRSDIWALGCVLYEMATGKRAFQGNSQASLIGAIMTSAPAPISQFAPMSPPGLERLVRQCLTRDPDERWQSAGDVRRELEWIAGSSSQSAAAMPAMPGRRRKSPRGAIGLIAGFVIAVAALAYSFGPWSTRTGETRLVRFTIEAPEGARLNLPAETAISPDGTMLAFVAGDSVGDSHLYLRPLSSPDARIVRGTAGAALPFWSPDGRMLAFFAQQKLLKVSLDGSAPVALCDAPDPRGGDWSREGVILFASNNQGPISRVSPNGGTPVEVTRVNKTRGELGHRYPQFLPDGKHFLFVAIGSGDDVTTFAASLDGGAPEEVRKAGSMARWAEPGFLLFLDTGVNSPRRRLLAQRFDPSSRTLSGDAVLLVDPVSSSNFGYSNAATDPHGTLVVQHQTPPHARLTWYDRTGAAAGVAVDDITFSGGAALSPDGARLAYGDLRVNDMFILDLKSGVATRLTFEGKRVNNPLWSPDGRTLAFSRVSASAGWDVYTKATDGTGADAQLFQGPGLFAYPRDWSRDGRWMVALCADTSGNFDLWKVPMGDGGGTPEIYQRTPAQEGGATFSPDGRWILYDANEAGKNGIFVQSFPEPGAKYQVTVPDAGGGGWTNRMDEILVANTQGEVFSMQVSTENGFRQGATRKLFKITPPNYFVAIDPGAQRFLMGTSRELSSRSRLEIVLGWPQLIQGQK